jgi:hypothetical protein
MASKVWTCLSCSAKCLAEQFFCAACGTPRYASWAVMVAEHVTEHLADGLSEPLDVLKAMQDRGIYRQSLTLDFIARQMRLLTKDTTALARAIAKARASRTMLEVLETGDTKDKLAVLKGIQVLGDVVTHAGEVTTRSVIELYDAPPPVKADE